VYGLPQFQSVRRGLYKLSATSKLISDWSTALRQCRWRYNLERVGIKSRLKTSHCGHLGVGKEQIHLHLTAKLEDAL